MSAVDPADLPRWRKSRRCDTASCVEVAPVGGGMRVRDGREVLSFSGQAWQAFLTEARDSKLTKVC